MLRTSLLDPYHTLHMTDLYLSGKMQLKFDHISRPRPVQLIDFEDLLSSPRPSLVHLNRLPTDFSDKNSAEVMVPSPTVCEVVIPFQMFPSPTVSMR